MMLNPFRNLVAAAALAVAAVPIAALADPIPPGAVASNVEAVGYTDLGSGLN